MNKDDLLELFRGCADHSPLFPVAQEAAMRINSSETVRVVISEPQGSEVVLRINDGVSQKIKSIADELFCKRPVGRIIPRRRTPVVICGNE
jgi:hypothetical protein